MRPTQRLLPALVIMILCLSLNMPALAQPTADQSTIPDAKSPILGLIDRQHTIWVDHDGGTPEFTLDNVSKFPGLFGGIVLNTSWNTLQPTEKGEIDFSSIDNALAQVRTYNAAHPTAPLGVKLRIWSGANAPDWAKQLDGGPVKILRNAGGCASSECPITVGKFWTAAYGKAWDRFQAAVAAKYDDEPLIRQVAVTACTQQTDEPFVPSVEAKAKTALKAAGYTDEAQQKCLMDALTTYAVWKTTLIDFSFNPFNKIEGGTEPDFTVKVMKACRTAFGKRCILDNQALNFPVPAAEKTAYETMQTLGKPIQLQTAGVKAMDCQWRAVIAQGVKIGAEAIEVWPEAQYQGYDNFTPAQVGQLADEFTSPKGVP